jgi:hypothetical protein
VSSASKALPWHFVDIPCRRIYYSDFFRPVAFVHLCRVVKPQRGETRSACFVHPRRLPRLYAQEVRFAAIVATPGLIEVYARVPREKFLAPAPWQISSPGTLYHSVVAALDGAKDIDNGQPGALASWIDALALQPGERASHLGCGVYCAVPSVDHNALDVRIIPPHARKT